MKQKNKKTKRKNMRKKGFKESFMNFFKNKKTVAISCAIIVIAISSVIVCKKCFFDSKSSSEDKLVDNSNNDTSLSAQELKKANNNGNLDKSLSIDDIQNIVGSVINQNRQVIANRGSKGMYQVTGKVNGIDYVVGFNNGRVGQLYLN